MAEANYQFGAGTLKDLEIIRQRERARKDMKWSYEWLLHSRSCHQRYPPCDTWVDRYLNSLATLTQPDVLTNLPLRTTLTLEEHLARQKMIKDALAASFPPPVTPEEEFTAFRARLAEYQAQIAAKEAVELKQKEDLQSLFKTLWPNTHASLCPPSTADIILSEYEKQKIINRVIEEEKLKSLPPLPILPPPVPPYHGVTISIGVNPPSTVTSSVNHLNPMSSYDQSTVPAGTYLINYDKINSDLRGAQEHVKTSRGLSAHHLTHHHNRLSHSVVDLSHAERRLHHKLNKLESELRHMDLSDQIHLPHICH